MSPDPASHVLSSSSEIGFEQRSRSRYEIALEVRCQLPDSGETLTGKTCDLSSNSIRFQVKTTFLPGTKLQLHIKWPFLLADVCPLQLVILGQVIRSDRTGTAVIMKRHEFRTLGSAGFRDAQSERLEVSLVP